MCTVSLDMGIEHKEIIELRPLANAHKKQEIDSFAPLSSAKVLFVGYGILTLSTTSEAINNTLMSFFVLQSLCKPNFIKIVQTIREWFEYKTFSTLPILYRGIIAERNVLKYALLLIKGYCLSKRSLNIPTGFFPSSQIFLPLFSTCGGSDQPNLISIR